MSSVRVSNEVLAEDLTKIATIIKAHPDAAYDEDVIRERETILDLVDARDTIARIKTAMLGFLTCRDAHCRAATTVLNEALAESKTITKTAVDDIEVKP